MGIIRKTVVKSQEFSTSEEVEKFLANRIDEGDCFEDFKIVADNQGYFIVFYIERDHSCLL